MKRLMLGVLLTLVYQSSQADSSADAEKSAQEAHALVQQKTATTEAIDSHLIQPLTSDVPMSTFDGKQQFSAKMLQHAGSELLKMTIQPQPSGDVKILTLAQDTKLSGKIDHYSQPHLIVSGVCANGFIRCDIGSWKNCQSFAWTIGSNQQLAIRQVPLSSLGGCYCINNSCGTGLAWSNLNDILSHLGGGAVGAIIEKQPLYSVGAPKIADNQVTYYGHNNGGTTAVSLTEIASTIQPQHLLGYAKNPQRIEELKVGEAKSNEIWQLIKESQDNEAALEFVSCRINRNITVDSVDPGDILLKVGGDGSLGFTDSHRRTLKLSLGDFQTKHGQKTMYKGAMMLEVRRPERIVRARLNYARFDDWLQVLANYVPIWSGPYNDWWDAAARPPGPGELDNTWQQNPNVDFTNHLKAARQFHFQYRLEVTGRGCGYLDAFVTLDVADRLNPDQIINGCSSYENNADYLLADETVDGVQTFRNYVKSGLVPTAQTKTVTGSNTAFTVTRDWFSKQRKYLRKNQPREKYNFDFERTRYIQQYSTDREYHDRYQDWHGGQTKTAQGDLFLTDAKPFDACTPTCKTKKPRPQNDVSNSGNEGYVVTGKTQHNPTTYDFFYRPCENGVCQIGVGEEVVKPCQCLQEFGEAASMMQLLRMAGNDLICSTGAQETLGSASEFKQQSYSAPNWVCGKEHDDDETARLQSCVLTEQGAQFCAIDAKPCDEETYEVDEEKYVEVVRVIPGRTERKRFLGIRVGSRWIPEQRIVERQLVRVRTPKIRYSCPLGQEYPCLKTSASTVYMCSPHQCINLANTQTIDSDVIDGATMADDGRRNAAGECLDRLYMFNGASAFCRTPGLQTAWKNCCKNQGKVVSDNTGGFSQLKMAGTAISAVFKASKAAYKGYVGCQAGGIAAAQAGATAAKSSLIVGFDPASIAASIAIGFAVDYLTSPCGESDMNAALMNASGFCVQVGTFCKQKLPLVGCVQRAKSFCCFNSKMARIIHEQGRRQLKTFNGFGGDKSPECRGFTPEEFQSLDFAQIDLSEYFGDLRRTLLPEMQQKMENKMQAYMQQTNH